MRIFAVSVGLCLFACAASAQQTTAAPPPTTLEVEQSRAAMLEAQLRYFIAVLRQTEATLQQRDSDEKVLAAWWAAYVAGLSPTVGEKK